MTTPSPLGNIIMMSRLKITWTVLSGATWRDIERAANARASPAYDFQKGGIPTFVGNSKASPAWRCRRRYATFG